MPRELIGDFYKRCNGYYSLEPASVTSVVPNTRGMPAMQFPGSTKTSIQRDMSPFVHERSKPKKAHLPSAPIVNQGTRKSYNLRTRSQNPPNPIPDSLPRSSSSLLDELRSESFQKIKDSLSKPLQELKDLYQNEQDQKSKLGAEGESVMSLYQSPIFKDSFSEYAASSSKQDISMLENLRKEHEKASKLKEDADERLKLLRSLKKVSEDDLFDLVSRKTSISRRTSVAGSPLPTRMPSISAGSTIDKRKISLTTYETVTQGSSSKPRTEHEELMRYIPQPLQRLIEKIDNPPKDGYCGYTCVVWSSGQGRGISTTELIRKHLSAELKKDKKMYEMIEGRNIDEDIRNTQAGKSIGVAGWLKIPLFGYAIANHLRRPFYYFSLDFMHTYLPTSSSYSNYPPFCMTFVNSNHYASSSFQKCSIGSITAPPIDGWWLRKLSSRNKKVWLQSLKNELMLFQKLMPPASGGAVINVD
ncbi:hypothetical protein BY996DRAFT_6520553 [Phakopsora pachyrhizi]|nr:hypothetical protein BY996DRAFT_6520553 [Phakopsora pachyrhizi]